MVWLWLVSRTSTPSVNLLASPDCSAKDYSSCLETVLEEAQEVYVRRVAASTFLARVPLFVSRSPTLFFSRLVWQKIDGLDGYGRTPMHLACRAGHAACVRLLVEAHARLDLVRDFLVTMARARGPLSPLVPPTPFLPYVTFSKHPANTPGDDAADAGLPGWLE